MANDFFSKTSNPLYSKYIALSRYARFREDLGRRELWPETVERLIDFWVEKQPENEKYLKNTIQPAILDLEVMPSMRSLMTAGKALERDHVAGYNCSFLSIDHPRSFDELMYILMCGTGVGYSVERQYVSKLPEVAEEMFNTDTVIKVADSKIGWASSLRELVSLLYAGKIPKWDLSKIRPAGSRLKTFGGRSSGPEPLNDLFNFTVQIFKNAKGRKLSSLEAHDLVCKIADIVVVGGVRRCMPAYSMIPTLDGIKKMEDITVGDRIITGGKDYKVIAHEMTGQKSILKIKHKFGKIECTPEHEVAVFNELNKYIFKKAKDLKEGDRLVWDLKGYDGKQTELPISKYENHFNSKEFSIPEYLNEDVAWLIGLIHGDGYVGTRRLEISGHSKEKEMLLEAKDIIKKYFKLDSMVSPDSKEGNGIRLRCNSVGFSTWLLDNIKKSNTSIDIPDFIKNSTRECRSAYLAGVFDSDGRITYQGVYEQVTTIYANYSEQIITLLSGLGIGSVSFSGSAEIRREKGIDAKDFASVRITGYTNKVNWMNQIGKFCKSNKKENSKIDLEEKKPSATLDFSYPCSFFEKKPQGYKPEGSVLISSKVGEELDKTTYVPTPVVSITEKGVETTYDIEVDEIHQFTTEGIVVHNSALISLSNLSDDRMRLAKSGQWWVDNSQRALANNSACYTEKPEFEIFMKEWLSLYDSKSGERGIFSQVASQKQAAKNGRRDETKVVGTNPCSEILLRDKQFCNLSEVVVRKDDTLETLKKKVEIATVLGTLQSTLTDFRYLRKEWQKNTEEERLLGVSLTGVMDNKLMSDMSEEESIKKVLSELKEVAVSTNKKWAEKLGVNQSTAITTNKPSGTVSQLTDTASGVHPRFSSYYLRTVRNDKKDPLSQFMIDKGFYYEDDVMTPSNYVFYFPIKSPETSINAESMGAMDQLRLWELYQDYWCEHKPSMTVYYRDDEFLDVGSWVWKKFDKISGVSFLPYSDHIYKQAPYQQITEEEYEDWLSKMPKNVNFSELAEYEKEDNTTGSQELSCVGNACELSI